MAEVRFEHVTKRYNEKATIISDLNLTIRNHEFLALVGPSGCGKSTALRMIAGLEEVTDGDLFIANRRVNDVAPKDRDIAMVFQNYALYPHMSVRDNMAFSLQLRRMPGADIERRVSQAAGMLGLGEYLARRPRELSGGQRQRVALGRALVREPQVFLLDEPLSNLDAKLRVQTRAEIARLHRLTGTTFVYVTHDQVEAMTMGDRIAVLNGGVVQQLGAPQDLYDSPANLFVAGFIGNPAMNFLAARLVATSGGGVALAFAGAAGAAPRVVTPDLTADPTQALASHATGGDGRAVIVGVRPEYLRPAPAESPNALAGVIELVEHLGNEQLLHITMPGAVTNEAQVAEAAQEAHTAPRVVARVAVGSRFTPGDAITLAVDTSRLHVFDPTTAQRLA
jgi:multiple sugar transport system ATP-binding protein